MDLADTSVDPMNETSLDTKLSEDRGVIESKQSKEEAPNDVKVERPRNVPSHLWEKFKALEKRTNETTKISTEKRIKHLQKKVLETVARECTSTEEREILREHDIHFASSSETGKKRKLSQNESSTSRGDISTEKAEIMSLMSVNNHLHTTDHSRPPPETSTEKRIALAIKEGDFSSAEVMSDRLATLEAGKKVAAAFDAKRFLEQKEREKETDKAKKKKKLQWGFEAKQRWETKGNM